MDAAPGAPYLPVPGGGLTARLGWWIAAFFPVMLNAPAARAVVEEKSPLHWSSDSTRWDRRKGVVELRGNARLDQIGESLTSDYMYLDLNARTVDARGNVVYKMSDLKINSEELKFNLDTRAGSIIGGRITDGNFLLVGDRINKLGARKFQTHNGQYTTCVDCPASWVMEGEDVDLEFEGYAFMQNVTTKVRDVPFMWFPYMIMPLKTKRQTGLLFPRFGSSSIHGFQFVLPFFWATSRSTDMTIGLGRYFGRVDDGNPDGFFSTGAGGRIEWEGRYALSEASTGRANFNYIRDLKPGAPKPDRWSFSLRQAQELPWGIEQKLLFHEVSDNLYPIEFREDVPGRGDPVLASDLIFSHATPQVSSALTARRFRNLLSQDATEFDARTVQLFPKLAVTTNERRLWGLPVSGGLSLGASNFARAANPFDYDIGSTPGGLFTPGVDPVRKALRFSVLPSLYTTFRAWDVISIVPSVRYPAYFYSFGNTLPNLSRGYLHFRGEVSTEMERVYETDDPEYPRYKHVVRPSVRYSRIPYVYEPDHPFLRQIDFRSGYNFDNNDIVPFGSSTSLVNYFEPQGHSVTYGVTTQLIRRKGAVDDANGSYQRFAELTAGQTLNILEFEKPEGTGIPLSRLYSTLSLDFDKLSQEIEYYFYPYLSRYPAVNLVDNYSPHEYTVSLRYTHEKATVQRVLSFERSLSLSYTFRKLESSTSSLGANLAYSLNDFILPSVSASYDFLKQKFVQTGLKLNFQGGGSNCWRFIVDLAHSIDLGASVAFDFALNLTGSGFGGLTEFQKGLEERSGH